MTGFCSYKKGRILTLYKFKCGKLLISDEHDEPSLDPIQKVKIMIPY